jgi:type I restriction enzyme S subunit
MGSTLVSGEFVFVTSEKARALSANLARAHDIIFTQRGTLGQVSIVPEVGFERYLISQSQMKLSLDRPRHEPRFVHHYFLSTPGQKQIVTSAIQTGVPHTNLGILRAYRFPAPPLLTGQTRLPGFKGEWVVKRLGDVAEMGSGGTPPSSVSAYYDGDIPWVSISDMTKGGKVILSTDRNLTCHGFANSAAQMFPIGTVLYAMYASLGECSIAGMSLCSSQAILGIRPRGNLSGEFLYYFLNSRKATVKTLGQQGTQANLNKGMVQDFHLSLPPLPEQTAIASVLSEMDAELAGLEQRREKTRALKQGMMQELLTGRTRLL